MKMKVSNLAVLVLFALICGLADAKGAKSKRISLSKILTFLQNRLSNNLRFRGRPRPTTTTTTPTPPGCEYFGDFFPPNSVISEGKDPANNWCYGTICDENGDVLSWDDFNCFGTTPKPTTTPPPPTPTPLGCMFNGKLYPPGAELSRGESKEYNWCYGQFCGDDGHILYWDNFKCFSTTPQTTTTPPSTPPPSTPPPSTPPPSTTPPSTTSPLPTTPVKRRVLKLLNKLIH